MLARHADWLVPRAEELFDAALEHGWDDDRGGFYHSFDRSHEPLVTEKYSWEVAEAVDAAAVLFEQTDEASYRKWYDRFWSYAKPNMVHPDSRNWYTIVTADNEAVPTREGVAVEPGYHPIGACLDGVRVFG